MKSWTKKSEEKIIICVWPLPSVSAHGGQMEATLDLTLNSLPHEGQSYKMLYCQNLCCWEFLNSQSQIFELYALHPTLAGQILTLTLFHPC